MLHAEYELRSPNSGNNNNFCNVNSNGNYNNNNANNNGGVAPCFAVYLVKVALGKINKDSKGVCNSL